METCVREEQCFEALRTCFDPELPVNIVDLGLIYSCDIRPLPDGGQEVVVQMTLTSPGCPTSDMLKRIVTAKLMKLPGVERVLVELVFDPPWEPSRMSDAARLQLGMM